MSDYMAFERRKKSIDSAFRLADINNERRTASKLVDDAAVIEEYLAKGKSSD